MGNETWTVILKEDASGGGADGGSAASTAMGDTLAKKPPEERQVWQDAGKVLGAVAGVSSLLGLIIGSIHRSKIFTTFMDAFLTIMAALADILLMPLVPILAPALMWFWKTMGPIMHDLSKALGEFIKDPWKGIQDMFAGIGDAIKTITAIFGGGPDSALGVIGANAATIFTKAGNEIAEHGKNMWQILTNKAIPWADKLTLIWKELQNMWTNFASDSTVQAAWKEIWTTIGNWFLTQVINPLRQQWDYLMGDYIPKLFTWVFTDWLPKTVNNMVFNALPDWAKTAASWMGGGVQTPGAAPTYNAPKWSGIGSDLLGGGVPQANQQTGTSTAPLNVVVTVETNRENSVESISAAVKKDPLAGWKKAAQYGATW